MAEGEQQGNQPTPEDAMAVGTAVAQSTEGAQSAGEARERAQQAARSEAESRNLELTEEQVKLIADGVVNQLEARGAFEPPPEPVQPPPAPAEPADPQVAAAAAAAATAPPKKRTFAQRYLGE